MIVITGATGDLGRLVVESLLSRLTTSQVAVSVRDPQKAADFAERGLRVLRGDFDQPETLIEAYAGATTLLMISSNATAFGGNPVAQHQASIKAAKLAAIGRIVYTSHAAASTSSAFPPMWTHARTERMLAESGLSWTVLRNGFYANAALRFLGDWQTGQVIAPADGKVGWTAHLRPGRRGSGTVADDATSDGTTPPLTGSEALDLAELASKIVGRLVTRRVLDDESYEAEVERRRFTATVAAMTLRFVQASRRSEFARIYPTLQSLINM